MEFFPTEDTKCANAPAAQKLFDGDTLIVPAVSYANLGQLTIDLVINTLLQRGDECDTAIHKVGHLFSTHVPPIAGATAYSTQDRNSLCLNLEVFRIPSRGVTIIQQRTDVTKGKARAFVDDLVDWASTSGFASLVVVAGADDMMRHDPNMRRRSLHTITFAPESKKLANADFLDASQAVVSENASVWSGFRGVGTTPLVHERCCEPSSSLGFVGFLLACAEGDNVPDAVAMATHVLHYLQIQLVAPPALMGSSLSPPSPFVFPPSWSQLFGRGPDVALFL